MTTRLPFHVAIVLLSWAATTSAQRPLRLNEIQVVGSHNSYHSGIAPNAMALLRKTNPQAADSLEYKHPSLTTQLNDGVRQIELDVFGDAKGGLFAHPNWPAMVEKAGLPADPPYEADLSKPGFKVLHVQDLDYRSNCQPFTACLGEVKQWSKAHPGHLPIFILVENKDGRSRPEFMVQAETVTAATFDLLDAEIRSVFAPADLITPDDVRGAHKTLNEAILTDGWPTLDAARGKVIFLLDQRRFEKLYTAGHPSLEGRPIFTNAEPGQPDAAFVQMNNPMSEELPGLVRKGYLIRTMTDPGPQGVRDNATTRRDTALASGAHMLSTDYPFVEAAASGYHVNLPDGIARCNPVLKPADCTSVTEK